MGSFQEFFAPSSSTNSFLRWTADLNHTIYLYGNAKSATSSSDQHGPDSCAHVNDKCPEIPHTRNLNGSIGLRLLVSESINSATSAVHFIFSRRWAGRTSMGIWRWEVIRITVSGAEFMLLQAEF